MIVGGKGYLPSMGVIRKTMSVGTLGIVNFRSKKERLERAEAAMSDAMSARDAERLAREVAESSFHKVESELRRLSSAEEKAAKQLARLRKRSRRVRKAESLSSVLSGATPMMKDGMESARTRGRKARKAARGAAKRASRDIRVGAEKVLGEARAVLAES